MKSCEKKFHLDGVEKTHCTDLQYREMGVENLIAREKYRRRIIGVEGEGRGSKGGRDCDGNWARRPLRGGEMSAAPAAMQ